MTEPILLEWPGPPSAGFRPDEAQARVVEHAAGNMRVLAGPGTGKTSVIVAAVHERLVRGRSADSMLVLTYGRLAAVELRQRLATVDRLVPVATTFHALAYRLLRARHPGLRLMGAPEQESVLRALVRNTRGLPAELEPARRSRGLAEQVRRFISRAQSAGLTPADGAGATGLQQWAWQMYAEYLDVIGFAGSVDYAELIRRATVEIGSDPPGEVRRLRTVFVDEYQDTDPSQVRFLQALASQGAEVVAVGDPDQAIYGFRGADVAGILRFDEVFAEPSCATVALAATRRFGPAIAAVARRVVPRNALTGVDAPAVRTHRNPEAHGPAHGSAAFRIYESPAAQADHIADLLRRVHAGTSGVFPGLRLDWSQMAVLVRSGQRDLPALQRALVAAGVPVEVARDDIPVAHNAAVRPLLDILRAAGQVDGGLTPQRARDLLASPLCGLDARRIARLGRTLRQRDRAGAGHAARTSGELLALALRDVSLLEGFDADIAARVVELAGILDRAEEQVRRAVPPSQILDGVWRATRWPQRLRREALGGGRRAREANLALDAVMEVFDIAERFDASYEGVQTVADLLTLLDDQEIPAAPDRQKPWARDAVRLLTAHRSKGSQWPLVVVAGVQDGTWPDLRARPELFGDPTGGNGSAWREERALEERRLFFVACTRAGRALLVTAVRGSAEDGPVPSPYVALAAGDDPVVEVAGRPRRPLTPVGVVAGLRQEYMDPDASPAMRAAVWQRLRDLTGELDARGQQIFPWADPQLWWGRRGWTANDSPWYPVDRPLPLSASAVEQYLACPRRWFLERRVKAADTSTTRLAFGTILHLCAQAVATGELPADEQEIGAVLDGVWDAVGYEPGWQARYEREQAQVATRRLLEWMRHTPGQLVGSEVGFDTELDLPSGEQVTVRGSADRVDRVGEQLLITDFKTGKPVTKQEAAQHVQLGLYRWVAELGALGQTGRAVAQLLFLRHDAPRGQELPGAKLMAQDTPDVPEWLAPVLDAAASGIRAEVAVARPGPGCRTCPVASSCPAHAKGSEVRP